MRIPIISLIVFLSFLPSCGRLGEDSDLTLDADRAPEASNPADGDSRPFGSGNGQLTLEQYAELMHRDLTGKSAPAGFTRSFAEAYRSGRGIRSIVADAVKATPALTSAADSIWSSASESHGAGRGVKGDGSRGFSATDLVLLYLAYSNSNSSSSYGGYGGGYGYGNYGSYGSSWKSSYYDLILPFYLTSKQYYYYLLYKYL